MVFRFLIVSMFFFILPQTTFALAEECEGQMVEVFNSAGVSYQDCKTRQSDAIATGKYSHCDLGHSGAPHMICIIECCKKTAASLELTEIEEILELESLLLKRYSSSK